MSGLLDVIAVVVAFLLLDLAWMTTKAVLRVVRRYRTHGRRRINDRDTLHLTDLTATAPLVNITEWDREIDQILAIVKDDTTPPLRGLR